MLILRPSLLPTFPSAPLLPAPLPSLSLISTQHALFPPIQSTLHARCFFIASPVQRFFFPAGTLAIFDVPRPMTTAQAISPCPPLTSDKRTVSPQDAQLTTLMASSAPLAFRARVFCCKCYAERSASGSEDLDFSPAIQQSLKHG